MTLWRPARLASLIVCLSALGPAGAWAMTSQGTLGDVLFGQSSADDRAGALPPVARFVSEEGESFVLDRSTPTPMLRFEESPEVLVLSPSPASRGDVVYRDDLGEPVLRMTRLGGLTLFAHARPGGAPAAMAGHAPSLGRLPALSATSLVVRLYQASARASHAARRLIAFDAQEVTPGAEAVFADAAGVTAEAVVRLSHRRDGAKVMARFNRVEFLPGRNADVQISNGAINVTVAPALGLAGRPSSARIANAAARAR